MERINLDEETNSFTVYKKILEIFGRKEKMDIRTFNVY